MLSVHVYLKFEILSSKFTSNGTSCCASYEFQNLMMKSTGKISGLIITVRNVAAARLFSQASVILFTGGGVYPSMHWGKYPTPPTATAADVTHPTGMHSCFLFKLTEHVFK